MRPLSTYDLHHLPTICPPSVSRQDQLVIQMLLPMDDLLKEQGLDLKLTPYRCLATAPGEGLVERVPDCLPLAQVPNPIP